MTYQIISGT